MDKVVIITGGASGIGLSTAQLFSKEGAKVILFDRNKNITSIATSISPKVSGFEVDVTDQDKVKEVVKIVKDTFGTIDILCNIAGVGHSAPPEHMNMNDWDTVLAINLTSLFFLSQQVGKEMIQQGNGKIINIASQAGVVAIPNHVAYSVSKAGVLAITRGLALDWGKYGITVNAISPTVVLTPMAADYWVGERAESHLKQIPIGRFAYPEEVAHAVLYLASEHANIMNGANLILDGGFTAVRV